MSFAGIARSMTLLVVAAGILAAAPIETARGSPVTLSAGWHVEERELVWTSTTALRMGGARYEFRSANQLLGYPVQSGNTLRLSVPRTSALSDLSVWAGGRRLDAAAPLRRAQPQVLPAERSIPQAAVDPAAPGPYSTQRLRYKLPPLPIERYAAPVEVLGEVTVPLGRSGPLPMVLLLHGRHSTCYRGGPFGDLSGDWPCPQGWQPIPSHSGYRYISDVLASQGYLTVSIAANGINGQDGLEPDGGASARSQLIRHHLTLWRSWTDAGGDPWDGRFRGRVDLSALVLVGHSRGGEGVERAAIDTNESDPWKIQGLVLIGPTAFGRQAAAGIHTTVILPFCDGDVSDLEGQQYVDIGRSLTSDPALRSSVMAMGTNHNFYNTEWTPGLSQAPSWDDWFDSNDRQCGELHSRRLSATEQQSVGAAYTAALVNLALAEDTRALPLLDGTRVKPPSIGRAHAIVHAIGGDKQLLYAAGSTARVTAQELTARECRGYFSVGPFDLRAGCAPDLQFELLPHWIPMSFVETAPAPRALEVKWARTGGRVRIPVSLDAAGAEALDFRIAGEPGAEPVDLGVRVRDGSGAWMDLGVRPMKLYSYYGPSPLGKVVARQIRADLRGTGLDPRGITAIELNPRTERGRFWLLDISTWRNSLAASDQIFLPKVSVGELVVIEGNSGQRTMNIPIAIEGQVRRRAKLWVQLTDFASFEDPTTGFPLVLEPGATSATVPFTYTADRIYNPYQQLTQVTLMARKNATTGDYHGSVLVEEDEPVPRLRVESRHVVAPEGSSIEWTFRLSQAMANGVFWSVQLLPPGGRFRELDTDDVPAAYLERFGITPPPVPAVPLSELGLGLGVEFEPGERVKTLAIPIASDAVPEEAEGVVALLDGFGDPVVPRPIELTAVVPGAP